MLSSLVVRADALVSYCERLIHAYRLHEALELSAKQCSDGGACVRAVCSMAALSCAALYLCMDLMRYLACANRVRSCELRYNEFACRY